jgi:uncharacterized membrane protein
MSTESTSRPLRFVPFGLRDIRRALRTGWAVFRALPGPSLALGALFASIGIALLLALTLVGASPLALVLAGGFLLIGPALLAGFFALYLCHEQGKAARIKDALGGFAAAGSGFWVLAGLCVFLFLVWLTDTGVLYAFQIGAGPLTEGPAGSWGWSALHPGVRRFALWSSHVGALLALGLYLVTAFSIPLLVERRAGVIAAIHASVRAAWGSLAAALVWAMIIALGILCGIVIPLLLMVTLPVLAYGSFALYRIGFPLGPDEHPGTAGFSSGIPDESEPQPGLEPDARRETVNPCRA